MAEIDPQQILLDHDSWATRKILEACVPLTEAQFHQRFDMGPGSLHDTTAHILGAMGRWEDTLRSRELRPRVDMDGRKRTPAELLAVLDEMARSFKEAANTGSSGDLVTRFRDGRTFTFPHAGVVMHVLTHGMHHRAQCLNMLKQLGMKPLPPSSVTEWMIETGMTKAG